MHNAVTTSAATAVTTTSPSGSRSHGRAPGHPPNSAPLARKPCGRQPYNVPPPSAVNHVLRRGTQARKQTTDTIEHPNRPSVSTGPVHGAAPNSWALSLWWSQAGRTRGAAQ
ncbi:hypothetical protein [Streptomyces buecherae]|uniref:Uncharacterized protein n=1 Tax=Streptomyces buecherae TaxID=2763006 RepID=A0A7H8N639_9ACTN|nr:hypothetical protein HUT08_10320 [Streptomyces buecherae]